MDSDTHDPRWTMDVPFRIQKGTYTVPIFNLNSAIVPREFTARYAIQKHSSA